MEIREFESFCNTVAGILQFNFAVNLIGETKRFESRPICNLIAEILRSDCIVNPLLTSSIVEISWSERI